MPNIGRVIVSLEGTSLTDAERAMLKHPMLTGIILFTRNYKDKVQLAALISEIQAIADLPIFADQEGGVVQRFARGGFATLPAPRAFGVVYDINKDAGLAFAEHEGALMAHELQEFGVTNLAPVCDLDAGNSVITGLGRAFHREPKACSELLFAYTKGMQSAGMAATGKHFPGHGQNIGDTHDSKVQDVRSLAEIEANDLVPFIDLIGAGRLAAIMPAHIVYPQIDPDHTAGTSKIWLEKLLRNKYGFNGVIISDCLSMKGAGDDDDSLLDKTEQTLLFADIALMCNKPTAEFVAVLDALQAKGYALDAKGQQRFAAWVDGSKPARTRLAQQKAAPTLQA